MEDSETKEIIEALGIKELAPEIYKDLLQPSAKELGKSLVTVAKTISMLLSPFGVIVRSYP